MSPVLSAGTWHCPSYQPTPPLVTMLRALAAALVLRVAIWGGIKSGSEPFVFLLAVASIIIIWGVHVVVIQDLGVPGNSSAIVPCVPVSGNDIHHDLPGIYRQVCVVEGPIELLFCNRLIGGVVVWRKIRIGKGVASLDAFPGVEYQHALEKFNGCERLGQQGD